MKRNVQRDLKKLARTFYENLQVVEGDGWGVGLDTKRPFGNSFIEGDVLEIIGWAPERNEDEGDYQYTPDQVNYARELYLDKLIPYLQKGKLK